MYKNANNKTLYDYANDISQRIQPGEYRRGRHFASSRLSKKLARAVHFLEKTCSQAGETPQAAEWIFDNRYIAERSGKAAADNIRYADYLRECVGASEPMVYIAAKAFAEFCEYSIDEDALKEFISGFQTELPFQETELQCFIPALNFCLVSTVCQLCLDTAERLDSGKPSLDIADKLNNIFTSLRFLADFCPEKLLNSLSKTESILSGDPAGIYPLMDEQSRVSYKNRLSRLAFESGISPLEAARQVIKLSAENNEHVGKYIFHVPLGTPAKEKSGGAYILINVLLTLFFTFLISFVLDSPFLAVLLVLPISDIIKNGVDFFVLRFSRVEMLHRIDLESGVPDNGKTLCVISALVSSPENGPELANALERYRTANRQCGKNLLFSVLADLPESPEKTLPQDESLIASVRDAIDKLNQKYGSGFYLFTRERTFYEKDDRYFGYERKRGAILELCRLLAGKASGLNCVCGDTSALSGTKYIIALDGDTRLDAGEAAKLIGTMLHPENIPVLDEHTKTVTSGRGIVQPHIASNLISVGKTEFSRIYSCQGGTEPYGVHGDVYQRLYKSGSFSGKGIIDVNAYLYCLDERIPDSTVLSHDLLEGAYLNCGYSGDIHLTDGFPATAASYFKRQHRWVRGDWQLLPWLFRKCPSYPTGRETNPLSQLNKWKIFDNLRRSLSPVLSFAAIFAGMLLTNTDLVWAALVSSVSIMSGLIITAAQLIFRPGTGRIRYISNLLLGFGGILLRTIVRLILLPYEAWVSFSAVASSIYRMAVSRKNMLLWQTFSDTEKKHRGSPLPYFVSMWLSIISGIAIILFTPFAPAAAWAIIWVLSPIYAFLISREKKSTPLNGKDEEFLINCAKDIWRFFADTLCVQDNFLPPDNYQEQPAGGIAHRTSPTNIGLALLSCLASMDLGITSKSEILPLITRCLDTIEKLPKWNGHLYNWYDTQSLDILPPAYISTVDSGNFAGCLIALREGLYTMGEIELAERAGKLYAAIDFSPLYDEKRNLFYIGVEPSKEKPGESWYDLLSSEARQTSYLAVAKGDVPLKHWNSLSRSLVGWKGYRGLVSWTGTMFEYLMPELLLPCYKDSLLYESIRFCMLVQKSAGRRHPWGKSESGYYSFDHALGYRYKAHGMRALALRRGMDSDDVISPYSSFLALMSERTAAVKNLRRLSELDSRGKYGFYEALDFTPSRLRGGREYMVVRSFMSHHLGMSLVALDNVLHNNIMIKRFMSYTDMASFSELLQEKIPSDGKSLGKPLPYAEAKPERDSTSTGWSYRSVGYNASTPVWCALGNGSYSVLQAETGQTFSAWQGLTLTKSSHRIFAMDTGITFYLLHKGTLTPLYPAPFYSDSVNYSCSFTGLEAEISAEFGAFKSEITTAVPYNESGEIRSVRITSRTDTEAELVCYFEPVISRTADFLSHPVFSKMSLDSSLHDDTIVFRRRPRVKGGEAAIAFSCDTPFTFDTSRETSLGRGGLPALNAALKNDSAGTLGSVLDPCVLLRVPINLKTGKTETVRFALTAAKSPEDCLNAARRILSLENTESVSPMDLAARTYLLDTPSLENAVRLMTRILCPTQIGICSENMVSALSKGVGALWSAGISGDNPIITEVLEGNEPDTLTLVRQHAFIAALGVKSDLVFLSSDGAEYRSPARESVNAALRSIGEEASYGTDGGVHLAESGSDGANASLALSVFTRGQELNANRNTPVKPTHVPFISNDYDFLSPEYKIEDSCVTFFCNNRLPLNAWSNILANKTFGFAATDCGTGHMWRQNARENKINYWNNDTLETNGTENLFLKTKQGRISLFASRDGFPCKVTFGPGFARWEKAVGNIHVKTTAFVPADTEARIFIIETKGVSEGEILYHTELSLSADAKECLTILTTCEDNILSAQNPYNREFPDTVFRLTCSETPNAFTCSQQEWRADNLSGRTGIGFPSCFAAAYPASDTVVIVCGCTDTETLRSLTDKEQCRKKLSETIKHWAELSGRITISTPNSALNEYINSWAVYQSAACRMLGRTSIYQSGGAYGFRDQLQDACALVWAEPEILKEQIILAAGHQFEEGDVQHWWHPALQTEGFGDKGVRTRCSDDLLWLPYALCRYVSFTGDKSILASMAGYIASPVLSGDELERYEQPSLSTKNNTILDHALLALDAVISRGTGSHGLCLIGSGDWNDSFNAVGEKGRGESVWLTFFAAHTMVETAKLCASLGMTEQAEKYKSAAAKYLEAGNNAWDGSWFLRGYYDDGSPLGSHVCDECQIDSIAQSFAVLAGAEHDKALTGVLSAENVLFDRENRVVRLFTPPFDKGTKNAGYVRGYGPGFRENGGQYTHGAIWLAMGLLLAGETDKGERVLSALLPQGRDMETYRVEPYVLPADVYYGGGHTGRGGWTWYTGAAGWFYRVTVENLLGIRSDNGKISITPSLPSFWDGFSAKVKHSDMMYSISVSRDENGNVISSITPGD